MLSVEIIQPDINYQRYESKPIQSFLDYRIFHYIIPYQACPEIFDHDQHGTLINAQKIIIEPFGGGIESIIISVFAP